MYFLTNSLHNASFREDYDTIGLIGGPVQEEVLPEGWERRYSPLKDQYYFIHAETMTIQWVEDHNSYPVGPFLLDDGWAGKPCPVEPFLLDNVAARGQLVHQGPGIRDSAGPVPVDASTGVLPYDSDSPDERQDTRGREVWTEDSTRRGTYRPLPPVGQFVGDKKKSNNQKRAAVSNLTVEEWFGLHELDRALEVVWVKDSSNAHRLALGDGRALPSKAADDSLKAYFRRSRHQRSAGKRPQ